MKIAKEKVYADRAGSLVPEGDPTAAILVATAGTEVKDSVVEKYKEAPFYFSDPQPVPVADANPLPEPFQEQNLLDTVSKLSGPGLAKLRSTLSNNFGIRLESTGAGQNSEQTTIILQTLDASPENPYVLTFDQHILTPFTGPGQFDLVERDLRRRSFGGASAGGTPILTDLSGVMNWQTGDADKTIRVGINPGRWYRIASRQSPTQVTLSDNIVLPSTGLTLTMDGEIQATIATKSGFSDGATTGSWSRLEKVITVDKVYSVVFVPGTAGNGIYSVSVRELLKGQ